MTMYTLGTGVGGGIIQNGRIWHGMTAWRASWDTTTSSRMGILAGAAAADAWSNTLRRRRLCAWRKRRSDSGNAPDLADAARGDVEFSSRGIYQLAIQGHPSAQKIYQRVGQALGIGIGRDG